MESITIRVAPEVRASTKFGPLVERANDWVKDLLKPVPNPVTADWNLAENSPPGAVIVTLADESGAAHGVFGDSELASETAFTYPFNRVVLGLIRKGIDASSDRLRAMAAATE